MNAHSHYETLSVSRNAPPEVIRAAYRVLSQKWHPDKNASAEAADAMLKLNLAYAELSDPGKRLRYDQLLQAQEFQWAFSHPPVQARRAPEPEPDPKATPQPKRSRSFFVDWDTVTELQRQQKRKYRVLSKSSLLAVLKAIALLVVTFVLLGRATLHG